MATMATRCAHGWSPVSSSSSSPLGRHNHKHGGPFMRRNGLSLLAKKKQITPLVCYSSSSSSTTEVLQPQHKLVSSLLSLVEGTDRGVFLTEEKHAKVGEIVAQLEQYCIPEPLKSPLIFGDWDVEYCSNPTSPGGIFRTAIGRFIFKTKEMTQNLIAPATVENQVSFAAFGALDGMVSLSGKLKPMDNKWIEITFDAPYVKLGAFEFQYGGTSQVKIAIIYLDESLRLGRGSRGSVFVFKRKA